MPIMFRRKLEVKRSKAEDAIPLIAGKASCFAAKAGLYPQCHAYAGQEQGQEERGRCA